MIITFFKKAITYFVKRILLKLMAKSLKFANIFLKRFLSLLKKILT